MIDSKSALHRLSILVKNHRAELGMTYREYSRLFGDLTPNISNIEKENLIDLPSVKTLSKLADILGWKLSQLIDYLEFGNSQNTSSNKVEISFLIAQISLIRDYEKLTDLDEALAVERLKYRPSRQNQDRSNRRGDEG